MSLSTRTEALLIAAGACMLPEPKHVAALIELAVDDDPLSKVHRQRCALVAARIASGQHVELVRSGLKLVARPYCGLEMVNLLGKDRGGIPAHVSRGAAGDQRGCDVNAYEALGRQHKVDKLCAYSIGKLVDALTGCDDEAWGSIATQAGVKPPSEETQAAVLGQLRAMAKGRDAQ